MPSVEWGGTEGKGEREREEREGREMDREAVEEVCMGRGPRGQSQIEKRN